MDADRLKSIPLFASLSRKDREHVARQADEVDVPEGKVLAAEGEIGWEFFVIESGNVSVEIEGSHVADLGPGDFFGEVALIEEGRRRTATATAASPVTVIVMTRQAFDDFRREAPEAAAQIEEAVRNYRR